MTIPVVTCTRCGERRELMDCCPTPACRLHWSTQASLLGIGGPYSLLNAEDCCACAECAPDAAPIDVTIDDRIADLYADDTNPRGGFEFL